MKYLHLILGPKPNIINNNKNKGQKPPLFCHTFTCWQWFWLIETHGLWRGWRIVFMSDVFICLFVWGFLRSQTVMGEKVNNYQQEISPRIQTNQNWNLFWLEMKKRKWVLRSRSKLGLVGGLGFGFITKSGWGSRTDLIMMKLSKPEYCSVKSRNLLSWDFVPKTENIFMVRDGSLTPPFSMCLLEWILQISLPQSLFSMILGSSRLKDTFKIKFYH